MSARSFLLRYGLPLLILATPCLPVSAQYTQEEVDYVIQRYVESMGGMAALQRIMSVRMSGKVEYPDGSRHSITVLKKRPDRVRVSLDTGTIRFIQAYNGTEAWFARKSGRREFHDRMRGDLKETFIREAPLENVLLSSRLRDNEVSITLGPDVTVAKELCYQVIARFPSGEKIIHYIEHDEFLERRILEYDADGNLVSELVPGSFETHAGVSFATSIVRLKDGKTVSTLQLEEIDVNVGILNNAFDPPVELPPQ